MSKCMPCAGENSIQEAIAVHSVGRPTSARRQVVARLESLRHTPADERWPGAIWPSDDAFDAARSFIECFPERMSAVADIGLADDGEINFLWKTESVDVDCVPTCKLRGHLLPLLQRRLSVDEAFASSAGQ